MSRRRDRRKPTQPKRERLSARQACLAALTALFIAAPLTVSESVAQLGSGMLLIVLHLILLAVWLATALLQRKTDFRWDLASVALVGLVLWQGVSLLVMSPHGAPRPALNVFWQWTAYGAAFLLAQDLIRSRAECRAVCAAMIALAVCLATHAYQQYAVEMPAERAAYLQDPEGTLRELGLYSPPGSVERELFEQRLFSPEPTATFALTNSLAGLLAPWLVLTTAALVVTRRQEVGGRRFLVGAILVVFWLGGCLLLTKSRTAWLATGMGMALVAASVYFRGKKLGWKVPLAAAAVLAATLGGAMAAGVLDRPVFDEAPKSLLYRFQYWNGSVRMIVDHPWLGCGPGNFQSYYTAYMLPEASEQVADPHNFLLEVGAAAGTPALLCLVLLLSVCGWRVLSGGRARPPDASGTMVEPSTSTAGDSATARAHMPIYVGALAGVALAYPAGLTAGMMPDTSVVWFGLPAAVATIWLLHPWVVRGTLDGRSVAIAAGVLLVNLLAAGGIGFPGVAGSLWLLLALACNLNGKGGRRVALPGWAVGGVFCLALVLLALCYGTAYAPVLRGRALLEQGERLVYVSRATRDAEVAEETLDAALGCFEAAAAADRFASEPWLDAARIYHARRLAAGNGDAGAAWNERFDHAAGQAVRLDRRSHTTAEEIGFMQFEAFDASGDDRYLARARAEFERAVQLFPNSSFTRARLACVYHLEGDTAAASREAAEALRLDDITPHRERKLRARGLFDDLAPPSQVAQLRQLPAHDSAEQLMQRLRRGSDAGANR